MKKFEEFKEYKSAEFGDIITIYKRGARRIFYKDNEGRHGVSAILTDNSGNEIAYIFNNTDIINA